VKAFNTILARHLYDLARPAGSPTAVPCPSRATSQPPRPRPSSYWTRDTVDAGSLAQSWRLQDLDPTLEHPTPQVCRGRHELEQGCGTGPSTAYGPSSTGSPAT
jgi:predicted dinucleotide-binding enzyme